MALDQQADETEKSTRRGTLQDSVADRLRAMITEGQLQPGQRIPEQAICDTLGISRTPLREALRALSAEGLVELEPNKGARVVTLSETDVDEAFEVMAALEALAGRLACEQISDAELADIRASHHEMLAHFHRGDLQRYFKTNQHIHQAILAAARNQTLVQMYASLSARIRLSRYHTTLSAAQWRQAVDEHEEILAALEERDGERLTRLLAQHLLHKKAVVKAHFLGKGVAGARSGGSETQGA
ncbi:MAG: GntR family transcriptional regulator [Alphaproteobacteria bacterium]|nr:GntR family transcriptional regulator [Alphaproteobacteria bacterium]